ncbi:MAG: sensor histidine kinase [Saprospiraceae bacterium]|nr:sensor histidine kinase [Saprospiraceae bacterium]
MGLIYRNSGEYGKSLFYFEDALKIRLKLRDSLGYAGVLNNIGVLKREQGDHQSAIDFHFRAVKIIQHIKGYPLKLASVYTNIANAFEQEKDWSNAIDYNLKSLAIYLEHGDTIDIINSKYNLATKYFNSKKYDYAKKILDEVVKYYVSEGNWEDQAMAFDFLGQIEIRQGLYEEADTHFKQSIRIFEANDSSSLGLFAAHANFGELQIVMKRPKIALKSFLIAQNILSTRGGMEDRNLLYDGLARCYHDLGKFDSAYYYQTQSKNFQDSIYSKDKATAIAEMQTKYETAEKERLASEAELKATQATTRSRTFLALFLAALAVAAATFFYFRHRQRTAALIAQQQEQLHLKEVEELLRDQEIKSINAVLEGQEVERVRIAKDLHDRLGSMLTTVKWSFDGYLEGSTDKQDLAPLVKANRMLDDAYQEVRRISHDMVSGVLTKFGLVTAVEELCSAINASGRLQAKLVVFGMEERPDNQVEITLYRVIQELMSNILKHAKASAVTIQISRIEDELNVTVEDDGQGFDPAAVKSSGMGLKNIEARVRGINGTVFFDTGKGSGTSVLIEVPV